MVWKQHLHGRTTELHSAQSLRREPVHSHSRALRCVTRPRERGLSPVGVGRSLGHALLLVGGGRLMCYLVEDRERCRVDRRVESSITNLRSKYRGNQSHLQLHPTRRPGRARTQA